MHTESAVRALHEQQRQHREDVIHAASIRAMLCAARGLSGRVRPSEPGSCNWRHACANDPVPFSGVKHWGAGPHTIGDATELRHRVRNIDGSICQCWMAR